ncbi:hypothetical protein P261_02874 [Lachnospiraceae bacterium TWA4]|nr:hypothetical protein P261_02874 [Lachnospiraceae bacterium TWA4]
MYSSHNASKTARVKLPSFVQDCQPKTTIAPSLILSVGSGIINFSSNSILNPRPAQTGHAPNGLLNEKLLGSTSSILTPQSGHEKLWLKVKGSPPITSTIINPSARFNAFSTESVKRLSIPSLTTNRSMTISMLCLIFLSRTISSDNSYKFPSTRTRTYPLFFACSNIFS